MYKKGVMHVQSWRSGYRPRCWTLKSLVLVGKRDSRHHSETDLGRNKLPTLMLVVLSFCP